MQISAFTRQGMRTFVFAAMLATLGCGSVFAQTTSFPYQGKLNDGGSPATGNYDFQFTLWDAISGGTQQPQPSPITVSLGSVPVSGGVFTVQLDFGAGAFPGANRWLEISVRPVGAGAFTTLSPRQPISSTPYAIRSVSASTADTATNATNATTATNASQLGGVAASQYVLTGDARLSNARPPTAGSANYIQNTNAAVAQTADFNVSGNGGVGGLLTANTVNTTTQYNQLGNRLLREDPQLFNLFVGLGAGAANPTGNENAFVGSSAGFKNTSGYANSFFGWLAGFSNVSGANNSFFGNSAGLNNDAGSFNSFFGYNAGVLNQAGQSNSFFGSHAGEQTTGSENSFLGEGAGYSNTTGSRITVIGFGGDVGSKNLTNSTAIGSCSRVDQNDSLVLGAVAGKNCAGATVNVGIGTTTPQTRLHVVGNTGLVGNLGIGTTSPVVALDLRGDGTVGSDWQQGQFRISGQSNSARQLSLGYDTSANVGAIQSGEANVQFTTLALNPQGGSVGIGTIAPDQKLSVNGNASKSGGGSWLSFSDERLKNIRGRFTPGLNAVMRLQPIRYQYKPDNALGIKSEGEHVGFSAQQVQQVIPEAVSKNDKGYLLVNNDPILWTMLNAIKEQQAQIEKQQKQIDELKRVACRSHAKVRVCR